MRPKKGDLITKEQQDEAKELARLIRLHAKIIIHEHDRTQHCNPKADAAVPCNVPEDDEGGSTTQGG